jgi:hypothetical protein
MPYTSVTRSSFRTNLRSRLGNTAFWADAELNSAINEAMRTWNLLTGVWCEKYLAPITGYNNWITLPSTITSSTRVEYKGKALKSVALRDLDNGVPSWEGLPGEPRYWAPAALNSIAVYPVNDVSNNSLTVDGVRRTPALSDDTDTVDLDPGTYDTLLDYARHVLLLKLGGREFTESAAARKALFEAAARTNQRIQGSAPYRKIMGLPLDSVRQPMTAGAPKVGVR